MNLPCASTTPSPESSFLLPAASKASAYSPTSRLDEAIRLAHHKPDKCIILQRSMDHAELLPGRDLDWSDAVAAAKPHDCVPVAATDPLYILYTSGHHRQSQRRCP